MMKHQYTILTLATLLSAAMAAWGAPQAPQPALGPYLQFTDRQHASVRWRTEEPESSILEYRELDGPWTRVEVGEKATLHELVLDVPKPHTVYEYRLLLPQGDEAVPTDPFECDTHFNYTVPPCGAPGESSPDAPATAIARDIVNALGTPKGYCLILGCAPDGLAQSIARESDLFILSVDDDAEAVNLARTTLHQARLYGLRAVARPIADPIALPFTKYFANAVILNGLASDENALGVFREALRLIRPEGGVLVLPKASASCITSDQIRAWLEGEDLPCTPTIHETEACLLLERPGLEGAGQWTHQYGSPDNSARSFEALGGATHTHDLQVQWVGRPGPRAMVDRNPRKPSPLYANGRLFTQGLHRIIAQDAYNGAIHWSLEIPHMERFNMPRDCSNWCTDGRHVYAAIHNACWRIDAANGNLDAVYPVVQPAAGAASDWGYIAQEGNLLFASAVVKNTAFTDFWGKAMAGWYDAPIGPVTFKVCSDALFALDKDSGKRKWTYEDGVIINPTITLANQHAYFVECREPSIKSDDARRVGSTKLWKKQFLVALDAQTGKKAWEQPIDTENGQVVFYMIHANDTLIIALSRTKYHLYAFDAADGQAKWHAEHDWTGKDHSGHMQHPVVAGNAVYLEPCGYDIASGKRLTDAVGRHEGCATYMAVDNALVYRGSGRRVSMWDVESGEITSWDRLRPGCWLSTVAGGGMLLSSEGGGGCSCGGWMETSLVFAPKGEE